jgi:two-component system LytT family sensor kinase
MEFDNDRLIKKRYPIEIFFWIFLVLINPLINALNIFYTDIKMWPVLLLVNIVLLPIYLLYDEWVFTKFFPRKNKVMFVFIALVTILLLHTIIFLLYLLLQQFSLSPYELDYFQFSLHTLVRETAWIIINLGFATGIYFIKTALDEKDLLQAAEKENNFLKLRYLRAQLNPHFLFNTLNSIYSLSLQKSDKAPEAVVKLADIMRYLIYECNENKIPLSKEIAFISNYIAIERIRFNADIRFEVEGDTEGILIEPFLFISFIENGFKHALDNMEIKPFIYINIKIKQEEIVLNVINNTNIDLETQAKRLYGKGISGSKTLLELLYPSSYKLDIIQTDKDEGQENKLRMKYAKDRLESLYPDAHTLDVLLKNNVFTVSLIIKQAA